MWTYSAGARWVLQSRLKRRLTLPVRVRSIVTVPFVPHETVFRVPLASTPGGPCAKAFSGPPRVSVKPSARPAATVTPSPASSSRGRVLIGLRHFATNLAAQLSHEMFTGLQPTIHEYGAKLTLDAFRRHRPQLEPHQSCARGGRLERRPGRVADPARSVADARPRRRRARPTRRAPVPRRSRGRPLGARAARGGGDTRAQPPGSGGSRPRQAAHRARPAPRRAAAPAHDADRAERAAARSRLSGGRQAALRQLGPGRKALPRPGGAARG